MNPESSSSRYRVILPRGSVEPTTPAEEGKPKRATTACRECKRRRTRCSSQYPCSECAAHNRECIFDENADRRRKVYTKMTQNQLEYYRGFLERLLQSIRAADPQQLETLIGVIRQESSSYDDIAVVVGEILGDGDNQSAAIPDYT
ncbi:hypothetical protein VTN49DRAFT_575 [Thermomyces lanuginosus]|uniref:uncharacterized protein n=1 Tax=Thermomyces lanuginosus TaxID=5541 RepID=UPI0037447C6A